MATALGKERVSLNFSVEPLHSTLLGLSKTKLKHRLDQQIASNYSIEDKRSPFHMFKDHSLLSLQPKTEQTATESTLQAQSKGKVPLPEAKKRSETRAVKSRQLATRSQKLKSKLCRSSLKMLGESKMGTESRLADTHSSFQAALKLQPRQVAAKVKTVVKRPVTSAALSRQSEASQWGLRVGKRCQDHNEALQFALDETDARREVIEQENMYGLVSLPANAKRSLIQFYSKASRTDYEEQIGRIQKEISALSFNLNKSVIANTEDKYFDFTSFYKAETGGFQKALDVVQGDVPVYCRVESDAFGNEAKRGKSKGLRSVAIKFKICEL